MTPPPAAAPKPDLTRLFAPRSVAVIGASEDTTKLRGQLFATLLKFPYDGAVYPVARGKTEISGHRAYASVAEIVEATGAPVDLAVLVIPAADVPDALERCGEAGVRAAAIISSGFAEQSGDEGAALQARLESVIARYGIAVLGPNAQGFANLAADLYPTFSPTVRNAQGSLLPDWDRASGGRISVIAQSGALGFSMFDAGRRRALPFRHVVTTGNEAGVTAFDVVDHLLDEGGAEIFLMFLEAIRDPDQFRRVAERALREGKPLIIAKIGRSEAAERAAASHTGALAGAYRAHRSMFEAYGVIEAESQGEMIDLASAFLANRHRLPKGRRVGVVTSSGGAGGWTADAIDDVGLTTPPLEAAARARIDPLLPAYGTSLNPVDATAQAINAVGYAELVRLVALSKEVDSVIGVTTAVAPEHYAKEGAHFAEVGRGCDKPVVFWSYTTASPEVFSLFAASGYPLAESARAAARMMAALTRYQERRQQFAPPLAAKPVATPKRGGEPKIRTLSEVESRRWLAKRGIGGGPGALAISPGEAERFAASFGGTAVFKVQSPDLPHKSDVGGVALNIRPEEAAERFAMLLQRVRAAAPDARIDGVLVEPMAPSGLEILVGLTRDPLFGPMLLIGTGGVYTEIFDDAALSPLIGDRAEARRLIDRLRSAPILDGARGGPPLDKEALVDLILALCRLAVKAGAEIEALDLNPVRVHEAGQGVSVLDALLIQRG